MKSRAARQMSVNKKRGNAGEDWAANRLAGIGVNMVEEIGTPFVITGRIRVHRKTYYSGYYKSKVSGDRHGYTDDGICVLAEVKTIDNRNLQWSDLDTHQPERLSLHAEKAISLLVWVSENGIYIMNWLDVLADGFGPGKGITIEQAKRLNIESL